MKKKIFIYLYIAVFLLALLLPSLGMLIFGPAKPAANEILASPTKLTNRDGSLNTAFLSDFSDYISDRFALRQSFVTAWTWLNAELLGSSVEDQVLLGSDGWLYYASTLDDYMGRGLSDGQLKSAARNLALMREYLDGQGIDFIFTVAPNKNSLYPGHMPLYIPTNHAASNAARLPAFLAAEQVPYVDLFAVFEAQAETLYYQTDSHWTNRGAALAADTLLTALGRETTYFGIDFDLSALSAPHLGDLYEMLYPAGKRMEADFAVALDFSTDSDPNGGDAITIRTHADGTGTLLCFRDSFGRALYPYLAQAYAEALFSRQAAYDLTRAVELEADAVLIELVERNIDYLLTQSAVFPAPERSDPPQAAGQTEEAVLIRVQAGTQGLFHVQGQLPQGTEQGAPIYLCQDGIWYEAGATLAEDGTDGFSAWLPEQSETLTLMVLRDGWILFPCLVEN